MGVKRELGFAARIARLDWDTDPDLSAHLEAILSELAFDGGRGLLCQLLRDLPGNDYLCGLCETNPTLQKLVLYECPETGTRLRCHKFFVFDAPVPHDHSWAFATLIMKGGYEHSIYAQSPSGDVGSRLCFCQELSEGMSYYLSPDCFHKTVVRAEALSIVLQGPRTKQSWTRHAEQIEVYRNGEGLQVGQRVLGLVEIEALAAEFLAILESPPTRPTA